MPEEFHREGRAGAGLAVVLVLLGCGLRELRAQEENESRPKNENQVKTETGDVAVTAYLWRGGKRELIAPADLPDVIRLACEVLESSKDRERRNVTEDSWKKLREGEKCVEVVFSRPEILNPASRPKTPVHSILFPLSTKEAYVLVKTEDGYLSPFSKLDEPRIELLRKRLKLE